MTKVDHTEHEILASSDEYYPLFEDLRELNWDMLRRKQPWKLGKELRLEPEYIDDKKTKLRDFWDVPMTLPVIKKEGVSNEFFQNIDWTNPKDTEEVLKTIESIKVRTVKFSKPIAIVYNPNSGKKTNIKQFITTRLQKAGLQFEFLMTQKAFDSFLIANTVDLTKFSAMIAVGGDGSMSEVFGGMLSRKDGLKVPVGYIPNGSGGVTAIEAGVFNLEMALDVIIKGMVTRQSAMEIIADDDKAEIPEGLEGFKKRRFCFLGMSSELLQVQMLEAAIPFKPLCGCRAYIIAMCKYLSCSTKKWK